MKALIVVDMLNDFIKEDGALYCGETAKAIVPHVASQVSQHLADGSPVIFLADAHAENDKEFDRFPKHCVKGSKGSHLIAPLNSVIVSTTEDSKTILIEKTRYSGFYDTDLAFHLQRLGVKEVTVVGVCTSICVMDTVGGLANRDYKINVVKDAVADFDPTMHEMALTRMENLYGAKMV